MGRMRPKNQALQMLYRFEYEKLGIGQALSRAEVKQFVGIVDGRTVSVDTPEVDPYYEIMLEFKIDESVHSWQKRDFKDDHDHKIWVKDTNCYFRLPIPKTEWSMDGNRDDKVTVGALVERLIIPYSLRLTMQDRSLVNQAMRSFRRRLRKG